MHPAVKSVLAEFDQRCQSVIDDINRTHELTNRILQESRTLRNGQKPPENFSPWTKKTRKKSKDRKQVVPNRRLALTPLPTWNHHLYMP